MATFLRHCVAQPAALTALILALATAEHWAAAAAASASTASLSRFDAIAASLPRYGACITDEIEEADVFSQPGHQLLQIDSARRPQKSTPVVEANRSGHKHLPQHAAGKAHATSHVDRDVKDKSAAGRNNSAHTHDGFNASLTNSSSAPPSKRPTKKTPPKKPIKKTPPKMLIKKPPSKLPIKAAHQKLAVNSVNKSSRVEQQMKKAADSRKAPAKARGASAKNKNFAVKRVEPANEQHGIGKRSKAPKANKAASSEGEGKAKLASASKADGKLTAGKAKVASGSKADARLAAGKAKVASGSKADARLAAGKAKVASARKADTKLTAGKAKVASVSKGKKLAAHVTAKKEQAEKLKTHHLAGKSGHTGKLKAQSPREKGIKAEKMKAAELAARSRNKRKKKALEELEEDEEESAEDSRTGTLFNPVIGSVVILMSAPAGLLLLAFGAFLWVKSQESTDMGA